jgi:HTH-type transcriptional regulator, sugar sensing transcriptional regulator
LIEELVALDLTSGEARVYTSLLRLGPSKVGAIVRESRVSYSKVYDVLERLGGKGLVSHVLIGKVRHFSAAEPYRLHDYIRKKEESLQGEKQMADRLIPGLLKYAGAGKRNSAEIFIGLKGLRTAYEILLKDAKQGDVLRYFYPLEGYHEIASPFYSRLYLFQKQKKLDERGIGTTVFKKSDHYKKLKIANMRFVSFPLPGTTDIFGDKMLIIAWESTTGILISSKEITDHFKQYFDSIWKLAKT